MIIMMQNLISNAKLTNNEILKKKKKKKSNKQVQQHQYITRIHRNRVSGRKQLKKSLVKVKKVFFELSHSEVDLLGRFFVSTFDDVIVYELSKHHE